MRRLWLWLYVRVYDLWLDCISGGVYLLCSRSSHVFTLWLLNNSVVVLVSTARLNLSVCGPSYGGWTCLATHPLLCGGVWTVGSIIVTRKRTRLCLEHVALICFLHTFENRNRNNPLDIENGVDGWSKQCCLRVMICRLMLFQIILCNIWHEIIYYSPLHLAWNAKETSFRRSRHVTVWSWKFLGILGRDPRVEGRAFKHNPTINFKIS